MYVVYIQVANTPGGWTIGYRSSNYNQCLAWAGMQRRQTQIRKG